MGHPWKVVRDHARLVVAIDMHVPPSSRETDSLTAMVTAEIRADDIAEVVLIGPKPLRSAAYADFFGIAKRIGTIVNDAGKAFTIAH